MYEIVGVYLLQFFSLISAVCMLLQLQNIWVQWFFFFSAPACVSTHINKKEIKSFTKPKRKKKPNQAWSSGEQYDKCWAVNKLERDLMLMTSASGSISHGLSICTHFRGGITEDLMQISKSSEHISLCSSKNSLKNQDEQGL